MISACVMSKVDDGSSPIESESYRTPSPFNRSNSSICFRPRRAAAPALKSQPGFLDDVAINLSRVFVLSVLDSESVLEALMTEREKFAEELQRQKIRTLMSMRLLTQQRSN